LKHGLPIAIQAAGKRDEADLAQALVLSDPIGAGYTLSQAELAEALGLQAPEVSILARAFKLADDGECAVVVRRGKKGAVMVNYHPRAFQRFREQVSTPPKGLSEKELQVLERVRRKLIMGC
jgi:hypothetical protein